MGLLLLGLVLVVGVPVLVLELLRRGDDDSVPFEDDGASCERARERDAGRRIQRNVLTMGDRNAG